MKNITKLIGITILALGSVSLFANNIQITKGPEIVSKDIAGQKIKVKVDLSWDNSWHLASTRNHDAVWVFMKYMKGSSTGDYKNTFNGFLHANLVPNKDIVCDPSSTPLRTRYGTSRLPNGDSVTVGVFLSRKNQGAGTTTIKDLELIWDIRGTGIEANSEIAVRVFAIEMVYVPEGAFSIGDNYSYNRLNSVGNYIFSAVNPPSLLSTPEYTNLLANVVSAETQFFSSSSFSVDLATPKSATWCMISNRRNSTHNYGTALGFVAQGSNDNATWTTVCNAYGGVAWVLNNSTDYMGEIPFVFDNPGYYRYYRFYFYTNYGSSNSTYNHRVKNIRIFDSDPTKINRIASEDSLYFLITNDAYTDKSKAISAAYPKGFKAFYCMKHELTQGAYCDFLNSLTDVQQVKLSPIELQLAVGTQFPPASSRMNIRLQKIAANGYPATFQCSQNGTDWGFEDNGENVPMFNLAWTDMASYLDWACLRPMTELEYEKACRGDLLPVMSEYAWGNASATHLSGVNNKNMSTEDPYYAGSNYSIAAGANPASYSGYWPVRAGSFAKAATTRAQAGASYWGILNLSDNVPERVININTAEGRAYTGEHGDGNLTFDAFADVENWPSLKAEMNNASSAIGTGYRGVSVTTTTISGLIPVSYRDAISGANIEQNRRDLWTGCRGVRTAE